MSQNLVYDRSECSCGVKTYGDLLSKITSADGLNWFSIHGKIPPLSEEQKAVLAMILYASPSLKGLEIHLDDVPDMYPSFLDVMRNARRPLMMTLFRLKDRDVPALADALFKSRIGRVTLYNDHLTEPAFYALIGALRMTEIEFSCCGSFDACVAHGYTRDLTFKRNLAHREVMALMGAVALKPAQVASSSASPPPTAARRFLNECGDLAVPHRVARMLVGD
jgi:hypothetical protein